MMSDRNLEETTRRFVALLGTQDRRLFGYILSLVPNYADAEELAQKVRLRLWEQFDEYDVEKDFGAWARTIAYYFVLAHRKAVAGRSSQLSDAAFKVIAERAATEVERLDDWQWALQECLGQLNESKRQLLMRYYSGETLREVAIQVGRSFDTVRHSVLRTRLALADCVARVLRREGA